MYSNCASTLNRLISIIVSEEEEEDQRQATNCSKWGNMCKLVDWFQRMWRNCLHTPTGRGLFTRRRRHKGRRPLIWLGSLIVVVGDHLFFFHFSFTLSIERARRIETFCNGTLSNNLFCKQQFHRQEVVSHLWLAWHSAVGSTNKRHSADSHFEECECWAVIS